MFWGYAINATRVVDPGVGAAFASKSLDLEQLSVSYMASAEDFFRACQPTWTWQRLESLALTSQLLQHTADHQKIDALLYKAGMAALQMPKLRTLVLWYGAKGTACAFIYSADRGNAAHVTWRGTWGMELSPHVVQVWERVALENQSCPLRVDKPQVCGTIRAHGDAIHHLALPCRVVEPASLWQIRREAMMQELASAP